jgi:nudix-type nucleoside diphosphatase (YffH/AdpP family)
MAPEILARDVVYAGYVRVERLRLRLSDATEATREVVSYGDAVAVLPFDPLAQTAMLVRLLRAPAFERTGALALEEACAGMIDGAAEDPVQTVRREALEELGLRLGTLERVGCLWPSPGVCAERVTLFLATYGPEDRVAAGGGLVAEGENITVLERPLDDLAADADRGAIVDLKLLALVQTLRLRRPELFRPAAEDTSARIG